MRNWEEIQELLRPYFELLAAFIVPVLVICGMKYHEHQQEFYKRLGKDGLLACANVENDYYMKGTYKYSLTYIYRNKLVAVIGYSQKKHPIGDSLSILFLPEEDEVFIQD